MSLVWMQGEIFHSDVQPLSLRNRGLNLGDGLFETVLVAHGVALWRDAHLHRLMASAEVLGLGVSRDDISAGVAELLQRGGVGLQVLRITVTRGNTARGLAGDAGQSLVFMTLDPFDAGMIGQAVTLHTSKIRRSEYAISSSHKTLSYVDAVVAAREAQAHGCGDALMLNGAGQVASSTIANIFIVQGNTLVTPSLDQGILPGVTRREILRGASALGYDAEERIMTLQDVLHSDGVFLCNSLRLIRPVAAIDGVVMAGFSASPILEHLCQNIHTQCGHDPRHIEEKT
jgi:branched-chain amino acid aminotransferase